MPEVQANRDIQAHPRRPARWIWLIAFALIVVVAGIVYAVVKPGMQTAANPPAVLAEPSVAGGVPALPAQTTTGRAVPSTGAEDKSKP